MAKIKVSGELEVATAEGKLADAAQVVDSTRNKTQEEINAQVAASLANKADKEGYVQIKVTGTAVAHYAKAADIPLSTAAGGYYLCDLAIGGVNRRVISIVAAGAIVNEISPSNGDTYICTGEGKLYAATANNTSSWTECGATGVRGEQGYGMVAAVSRPSLTEAQWELYGTEGRNEEWSGTSGTRNGCRIGDLFTVSGTSTDGGRAHFLLFRSTTATGNLTGTCIGHTVAERGKAATVSVGTVTTGDAGTSATVTNSGTSEDVVLDFTIPKGEQGESAVNVVQGTGTSTTDVMSQYAVTQELFNQKYSFLIENCEYVKDANIANYASSTRSGNITAAKYPEISEIILDITVKAVASEGVYSICGGRVGGANVVNMLLVKNGKLAYCNGYNISANTVETDYEFDDSYHHIISIWGATYQKIYVDGSLIVNLSGLASRGMYIGYNGVCWLAYQGNGSKTAVAPDGVSVKGVASLYINGELVNMFFGKKDGNGVMRPYLWSSLSSDYSFELSRYGNYEQGAYVFEPWADLPEFNITEIDHVNGTVTLDTEEHGLQVGDKVAITYNVGFVSTYNNPTFYTSDTTTLSPKNFPLKRREGTKVVTIEEVDGAVIKSSEFVVTTSFTYTYTAWRLQKLPSESTAARYIDIPKDIAMRPMNIRVETQILNYASEWSFLGNFDFVSSSGTILQSVHIDDMICGVPFVVCEISIGKGHVSLNDYGREYMDEKQSMGSGGLYWKRKQYKDYDFTQMYRLRVRRHLAHKHCKIIFSPYHTV